MDFMSDRLFDGKPFRILTIVDCHRRKALATAARTNFKAYQVIEELDRLARLRGKPRSIRIDNGPEFAGRLLDQWAYLNKVGLVFSRSGKPTDNAYIEAFNSRLRQEYRPLLRAPSLHLVLIGNRTRATVQSIEARERRQMILQGMQPTSGTSISYRTLSVVI